MRLSKRMSAAVLCFLMIAVSVCFPFSVCAVEEIAISSAAASSQHPLRPAANSIDRNTTSTYWETLSSDKAPTLTLDLGAAKSFNKITLLSTFPTSIKGFTLVAADSADMTQGAVLLTQGTAQSQTNNYTFPTVNKRYIRYSVTSFSGRVGVIEISVFQIVPSEMMMLDSTVEISIPKNGETAFAELPAYILRDESGALIPSELFAAQYSLETAEGVSIEGDRIVVSDRAQEAELTLSVTLTGVPGVSAQAVVRLVTGEISESDRTYPIVDASATSANGVHQPKNMIDDSTSTRWQALSKDTNPVIRFDLGKTRKFNQIKINHLYPQNVKKYVLEAADSEDMSVGCVVLAEGAATASIESLTFPAVNKRYVRYTFAETDGGIAVMDFKILNTVPAVLDFAGEIEPIAIPRVGEEDAAVTLPEVLVKNAEGTVLSGDYPMSLKTDAEGVSVIGNQLRISSDAEDQMLVIRAELQDNPSVYGELSFSIYSQGFRPDETDKEIPIASASASTNHGSYPPSNTIDGILTTRWQPFSFDTKPAVTFDLGKRTAFNKIMMVPTAVATVKSFLLEAADDPAMTENRVVLAEGTDIGNPAVFTFETVRRRYIKYTLLKTEGTPGILEFSVHYTVPDEIAFREIISDVGIPAVGEGARHIRLPETVVTDSSGDEIHPGNYTVEYNVSGGNGVSISNGELVVEETAEEGEFMLSAFVKGKESVSAAMTIRTFVKENLLSGKPAEDGNGKPTAVLTDNHYTTGCDLSGEDVFVFDAGEVMTFNKYVIKLENAENVYEITVSGALNVDFSDETEILSVRGAEGDLLKLTSEMRQARRLKLTVKSEGAARLAEFEAYEVYPSVLHPAVTRKTVYIPVFSEGTARREPAVAVSVLDRYGDPVFEEDARLIWSAPEGLSQGVTLDADTGVLTVEPDASATSFVLRAQSAAVSSLYTDISIDLKETVAEDAAPDHLAYGKTVKASRLHPSYPAENATDGSESTRLQFSGSAPYFLTVDLGEECTFNTLTVHFLSASGIVNPTVRAANEESALTEESSVIATMVSPLRKTATVSMPVTSARYVMLYIPEASNGCAITELELRYLDHALILASVPEVLMIGEETVTTEPPAVDIKDENGVSMVIAPEDYFFEAVRLPSGVVLHEDGSLTVGAEAEEGMIIIRAHSAKNSTVYSDYSIKLLAEAEEPEENSTAERLHSIADGFSIENYVPGAVAKRDFTLPRQLNGASVSYRILSGGSAVEIDESGNAAVNRGMSEVYVRLSVCFSLDNEQEIREYDIRVPAKESGGSGGSGSSGGSGGGGSGGGMGGSVPAGAAPKTEEIQGGFSDIGEVPWAKPYLQQLVGRGILNGSDGLLRPKSDVTREEFVKMIVTAFLADAEKGENGFTDVPQDSWYCPYVSVGVSAGIIRGISAEEFGTGRAITREDAAVILVRTMARMGRTAQTEAMTAFSDSAEIAEYAKGAVEQLRQMGVVSGTEENKFMPRANITRAEAAKMIGILIQEEQNENE